MASSSLPHQEGVSPIEKRVLWIAIIFTALTIALIAYSVFALHASVPTCMPNMLVFRSGAIVKHGEKNYEIHFLARMWRFEPSKVVVPVGSTLDVAVTSKDVTHGFQILGTNVNLMALPFVLTTGHVHFNKPGIYHVVCHEYCGAAHQNMSAIIEVSNQVDDISAEGLPSLNAGQTLADAKGCLACHSIDGTSGVGPSFRGLWGQTSQLADGSTRIVDAGFVKAMIQHPEATPVKGFDPVMPAVPLNDDEVEQLADYIEELQ
ncbi:MAG: c-type cytochrome [Terriglobales bacterium]|jgi:cytochrome c oxidase subunit 2